MSNNRELSEFADYLVVDDTTKNVGIGTTLKISAGGIFVANTEVIRPDGTWGGPNSGLVGAQGAQGAVGAQGAQGAVGAQGAQGAAGAQGAVGAQGAQGAAGAQGAVGAQGNQGRQGATGAQGSAGTTAATFSKYVTFNSSGTISNQSGVSSVSRASDGRFTVNFNGNLSNSTYYVSMCSGQTSGFNDGAIAWIGMTKSTSAIEYYSSANNNGGRSFDLNQLVIFTIP